MDAHKKKASVKTKIQVEASRKFVYWLAFDDQVDASW